MTCPNCLKEILNTADSPCKCDHKDMLEGLQFIKLLESEREK